jgi:hypothetical protein
MRRFSKLSLAFFVKNSAINRGSDNAIRAVSSRTPQGRENFACYSTLACVHSWNT